MIKVLVVDDSAVARELLTHLLSADPEIKVIGTATNGLEAVEMVGRLKPDVVTMDIIMPKMDGYEATRRIMQTTPLPIVVVSASLVREEVEKTWRAVDAGAVAVLPKPGMFDRDRHEGAADKLVETVKIMSQVKVVRRWSRPAGPSPTGIAAPALGVSAPRREVKVVAIGASTGGPPVLQRIFSILPASYPRPILLVQHIAAGFVVGFVDWLNRTSSLTVRLASHGETVMPGHVYVAPDGRQMKIDRSLKIALVDAAPENGLRPSVSYLFRSVAGAFGPKAVGVILTGMGRDGADELKLMHDAGALTIAQDKESSIVWGMPAEAAKLGAAEHLLPPEKIAEMLANVVR